MYYVLFNPLSSNGKSLKQLEKLKKKLNELHAEFQELNILEETKNIDEFVNKLAKEDIIVIVGGDGTIHHFANYLAPYNISNNILLFKGGTGNDFSREFKGDLIDIKKYIEDVPYFEIDGKKEYFLNGTGFGVDGVVCNLVNSGKGDKKGIQYFKNAVKAFTSFPRFDLEVYVDGVRHNFKNCWFATVMNGKYFGGGMCLNPYANRNDEVLELYVIHSLGLAKLLPIFPTIFIGKHMNFKHHGITLLRGKKFELYSNIPNTLQTDGEVILDVKKFIVER